MNRKQLPVSVKVSVTKQILQGEWTIDEAAEAIGFSVQTVRRWVSALPWAGGPDVSESIEAPACPEPSSGELLDASVRELLDGIMLRRPHLRRRSLQDYLRRHHDLDLPRRIVASYL